MEKDDEYQEFYDRCLLDLKAQGNYSDAYLPILDRYVFITMKVAALGVQIADEEVAVEHKNNKSKVNTVTSPKWRMFLALDAQAGLLAKQLRLSPATAPKSVKVAKKAGFDTENKMKVA